MGPTTTLLHRLDPEVAAPLKGMMEATGGGLDLRDLAAARAVVAAMTEAMQAGAPGIPGVDAAERIIPGNDGRSDIPVRIYRPADRAGRLPALLWMHGGGWVLGSAAMDDLMLRQLARDVGCVAVAVDYRLAPENPFPAPLEDCYAVFSWLARDSGSLHVDPARIAIGGVSAGANLAAGLALLARDRSATQAVLQLLVCPVLDDGNVAPASETLPDNLFWSRENALFGWRSYLGPLFGAPEVPPEAAPIRAQRLDGLPPACIAAGEVDMFADDAIEYARRLLRAGVPAELHVYPGACHAFDSLAPQACVSQRFIADRNAALARAFGAPLS